MNNLQNKKSYSILFTNSDENFNTWENFTGTLVSIRFLVVSSTHLDHLIIESSLDTIRVGSCYDLMFFR